LLSGLHGDFATHGVGSGAYRYVTTDQVRFYLADTSEPIPLADISPLALSEIFRDIDLFVSVCTIGNNPTWEQPDADDRYERYWRSYNTGELSNTARSAPLMTGSCASRAPCAATRSTWDRAAS
jgi:hypothetical protein